MKFRTALTGATLVLLAAAPAAQADTVVNPYAGNWTTQLDHQVPGTVAFRVISEQQGENDMPAYGGHLCADPTTYYHGDFTDNSSGQQQTGTMTACVDNGSLVGRWSGSGAMGSFTVQLQSSTKFLGSYTLDGDPTQHDYMGTFQSRFPGDGCCTSSTTTTNTGTGGGSLALPTQFCPAAGKCAPRKALTVAEKSSAKQERRVAFKSALIVCGVGFGKPEYEENRATFLTLCFLSLAAYKEADAVVQDPPDRAFTTPPRPLCRTEHRRPTPPPVRAPSAQRSAAHSAPHSPTTRPPRRLQIPWRAIWPREPTRSQGRLRPTALVPPSFKRHTQR